jgi:hypothetical protein
MCSELLGLHLPVTCTIEPVYSGHCVRQEPPYLFKLQVAYLHTSNKSSHCTSLLQPKQTGIWGYVQNTLHIILSVLGFSIQALCILIGLDS